MPSDFKCATGIVAEYNPLHRGHVYHIEETKKRSPQPIVVVLSSNFTQRGEPAFIDKWTRAEMALNSGADLILELPVMFSCHNAGVFAGGAIDILAATSIVNKVSFGMETISPELKATVDILIHEPKPFKLALKSFLNDGYSYVESRAKAAGQINAESEKILSMPNNSLAISYMCRIAERGYDIDILPVPRKGASYHDTSSEKDFPSASAIRKAFREKRTYDIIHGLSPKIVSIIKDRTTSGRCFLSSHRLWDFLNFLLIRTTPEKLRKYAEFSEGIENRFISMRSRASSWDEFINLCTTKRYPRGRLQRNLVHFLIGMGHEENRIYQKKGPAYIRVLGANDVGRCMLKEIERKGTLPVISKFSQIKDNPYAVNMMKAERRASSIWETFLKGGRPDDISKKIPIMF